MRVRQGPKSAVWLRIWYRVAAKGAGYVALISFRWYVVAFGELFWPVRATYILFLVAPSRWGHSFGPWCTTFL